MTAFVRGEIRATLTSALRAAVANELFEKKLPKFAEAGHIANIRFGFLLVASHTASVEAGLDWQPPPLFADESALMDSFERFISLTDNDLLVDWVDAINEMIASTAPPEEQSAESGDEENPMSANEGKPSGGAI